MRLLFIAWLILYQCGTALSFLHRRFRNTRAVNGCFTRQQPLRSSVVNSIESKASSEAQPDQTLQANPPNFKSFEWTKQWYPIAVESFTDKGRPNKMQLLGNDFVLWYDGKAWRAFDDTCPHRGVPLSEGRIEKTGELLCAYHAWRFDGEGKCTSIPQSRTKEKEEALKVNANACVRSYPTQVAQGLIWCWGEMGLPGSNVALEAALKAPQLIEELSDPQYAGRILPYKWNFRDLPYGWDFFMENTLDPAHVVVSHHGIVGDRYKDPTYLNLTRVPSRTEIPVSEGGLFKPAHPEDVGFNHLIQDGPTLAATARDSNATSKQFVSQSYNDFRPPCLNKIERCGADGSKLILALYATPTRPGYCRHIGAQMLIKSSDNKIPQGLGAFAIPMPTWILHLTASLFLHQDQVFLHHQERKLYHTNRYAFGRFPANMFSGFSGPEAASESGGPKNSDRDDLSLRNDPKSYAARHFTPNEHDLGISKLRQWIHRAAAGGPVWGSAALAQGLPPVLPPEQLFDVYHSHVASCTVCQAALKNTIRVRNAALGTLFALLFIWRPSRRVRTVVSAVAGLTALAAEALKKYFYVFRYNHQDNN